jgi:5-methylcytosine-specific restriction endonuclease McrA
MTAVPVTLWTYSYYLAYLAKTPTMTEACIYRSRRRKIKKDVRASVFAIKGRACTWCGETEKEITLDHIHPWGKGGCSHFHNLQPMCDDCNQLKADSLENRMPTIEELVQRFMER